MAPSSDTNDISPLDTFCICDWISCSVSVSLKIALHFNWWHCRFALVYSLPSVPAYHYELPHIHHRLFRLAAPPNPATYMCCRREILLRTDEHAMSIVPEAVLRDDSFGLTDFFSAARSR